MLEKNVKYPYKIHFLANPCFDIASESINACIRLTIGDRENGEPHRERCTLH